MDVKKCVQSKKFKVAVMILGGLFVASLIFQAGIFVGYHKAAFSYGYGDNYYRMFGEERRAGGMMGFGGMMGRGDFDEDFAPAHGVIGKIVKVELPVVVIEGSDSVEKVILITPNTTIRQFRNNVSVNDLKVGDIVTIIGTPNTASQIEAQYIRLMPGSAEGMMWATSTSATATLPAAR